ncbi:hypothetical protein Cgig2_013507 [Carnegiea gigantea]|uniref:GB1/RHD3-type G domain-containing protein n=1 Tax=Carnegiea gigantea TaxID=171969 RepID=A0A9Q1GRS7_9CARY|nr:hypothetical protein Cgig2_013507 [Carnegiea gigantea]
MKSENHIKGFVFVSEAEKKKQANGGSDYDSGFPIVEPDPGHTRLRLSREGLEAIQRINSPIAAVAVIGPYRSGKSFLLNQLLSLSCNEGFGVGHMRDTKTKGIWVWGTPIEVNVDGIKTSVLYLDTEGFESIGKSNVYDDRIFALATVMSSVLIYNLPETVREADISRLSFAVELAEEFYGSMPTGPNLPKFHIGDSLLQNVDQGTSIGRRSFTGEDIAFEPAKLLWLIQRDFLRKFPNLFCRVFVSVICISQLPSNLCPSIHDA